MSEARTISHDEARALLRDEAPIVLDVRTPAEHEQLGHIPASWLLPLDLIMAAPAVLPAADRPVLVYCEHGVRSMAACRVLSQAGVQNVLNLAGGMAIWSGPREFGRSPVKGPSPWLLANADLLPRGGEVLDLACGRGRHALLLAGAGFRVRAVDRDADALAFLRRTADDLGVDVECRQQDLETDPPPDLGHADIVLAFNYLHRPLMPAVTRAVRTGGILIYETFTRAQAARGKPDNPAFLLDEGELPRLVQPLQVVRAREGEFDGRFVASVVARP